MDLKQGKPIHLKCPKCGYDFAYHTNHIEAEIDSTKVALDSIKSQLTQYKCEHPNPHERNRNPWYRSAQAAYTAKEARLSELKRARKATASEVEVQVCTLYRKHVREIIGMEKEIELHERAEQDLVYREYDMAIQKHNNFEKA